MSDAERMWLIERTRISTDYQHVAAYSAAAAMEIALDAQPQKWNVKRGLADDPNATYVVRPLEKSTE
jgi:hypothetical protein